MRSSPARAGASGLSTAMIVGVRNALPTSLTPALAVRLCYVGLLPLAVLALVLLELL